MSFPTNPIALHAASADDQRGVIDALYRFGAGQDLGDAALFRSAFAEHAVLDFIQPAQKLGAELPLFTGREGIAASILPVVARLDTTHTVSNPRVQVDGDTASLFALVEAMHLPKGEHTRRLLLKNFYWLKLQREAPLWTITEMRIHNVWISGDPAVLFGS
jgi:hypothetical protein